MKICINGARLNVACSFNNLSQETEWADLTEQQKESWHKLRQSIAILLLIHDECETHELNPDILVKMPEDSPQQYTESKD